ncbi:hypothetical protein BD770DRAFT_413923 [Pilaira anomala]|nr:hypothetical protein BD770DRAFT_413923 [Pilaira anomala]
MSTKFGQWAGFVTCNWLMKRKVFHWCFTAAFNCMFCSLEYIYERHCVYHAWSLLGARTSLAGENWFEKTSSYKLVDLFANIARYNARVPLVFTAAFNCMFCSLEYIYERHCVYHAWSLLGARTSLAGENWFEKVFHWCFTAAFNCMCCSLEYIYERHCVYQCMVSFRRVPLVFTAAFNCMFCSLEYIYERHCVYHAWSLLGARTSLAGENWFEKEEFHCGPLHPNGRIRYDTIKLDFDVPLVNWSKFGN